MALGGNISYKIFDVITLFFLSTPVDHTETDFSIILRGEPTRVKY